MENTEVLRALLWLWDALTSPTSTWLQTLVAGAIGAAAGSFATQSAINRHEQLADARAELNAANHAINICFVIMNQYLSFKRQMVLPMVQAFQTLDEDFARARTAPIAGVMTFDTDLKVLPAVDPPIDQLERLVLEKVSMGGRGLSAAMQIRGVAQLLNGALIERAKLIQKIEDRQLDGPELAALYLGLETDRGADTRFKDNIRAISLYADDGIFFTHQTMRDLRKHAVELLQKHGRKLGSTRRAVPSFDFTKTPEGLVPPDSAYAAWLQGFSNRKPWWKFWDRPQQEVVNSPNPAS